MSTTAASTPPYSIAIAGSSKHATALAATLAQETNFAVKWTLSPVPKPSGRQQFLTQNPLHRWSLEQQVPAFLVKHKIDQELHQQLSAAPAIDLLLVVDFGYLVPTWLLQLPRVAPLNIHPSLLPAWRGSSPGQFALLHYDLLPESRHSAVSLMVINDRFDQGALLAQLPVTIQANWTTADYYQHCFDLITPQLSSLLTQFLTGRLTPSAQPEQSPTQLARQLQKTDSFLPWSQLQTLLQPDSPAVVTITSTGLLSKLLNDRQLCPSRQQQRQLLHNASHAFWPWPGLWTLVPTPQGEKRLKIMPFRSEQLQTVQLEGKTPCQWREMRNNIMG